MEINGSTRIIDMTLDQLFAALDERDAERKKAAQDLAQLPPLVYGLQGLQDLYHCSKTTASRILRSGKIDAAVTRVGRKQIVINTAKALSLCGNV